MMWYVRFPVALVLTCIFTIVLLESYASNWDAALSAFRDPTFLNILLHWIGHAVEAELLFVVIVKLTHCLHPYCNIKHADSSSLLINGKSCSWVRANSPSVGLIGPATGPDRHDDKQLAKGKWESYSKICTAINSPLSKTKSKSMLLQLAQYQHILAQLRNQVLFWCLF